MDKVFKEYARIYDVIYAKKDYRSECDFLAKVFKRYAKRPVQSVLDVACGTGNHVIPLAKMGFKVYAQDLSAGMLAIAKDKSLRENLRISFLGCHPMQKFSHDHKFDAVIAMFSSLDYLISPGDLKKALINIRRSLKKDGLFTFDFWNKDCVTRYFTPAKRKSFSSGNKRVTRVSSTSLDRKNNLAKISYLCDYFVNGKHSGRISELHRMKYYKINDMLKILDACGFNVLGCFPFMGLKNKITPREWNISVVASPKE